MSMMSLTWGSNVHPDIYKILKPYLENFFCSNTERNTDIRNRHNTGIRRDSQRVQSSATALLRVPAERAAKNVPESISTSICCYFDQIILKQNNLKRLPFLCY